MLLRGPRRSEGHVNFNAEFAALPPWIDRRMRGRLGWRVTFHPRHDDEPRTAYRRTITPLRKRRPSTSSRFSRTPSGKNRFPLPTTTGQIIISNSSTRLALIASAPRIAIGDSGAQNHAPTANPLASKCVRRKCYESCSRSSCQQFVAD